MRTCLINPQHAGLLRHRGTVVGEGQWPAIVDKEQWDQLCLMLRDPARLTTGSRGRQPVHLLSGMLVCSVCGERCRVGSARRVPMYRCRTGCVSKRPETLEEYVVEATIRELTVMPERQVPADLFGTTAARDAETIRARLDALAVDYADGVLTREQVAAAGARLRARLADVERTITGSARRKALVGMTGAGAADAWTRLDLDRRRAVLRELWEPIVLVPSGQGRRDGIGPAGVRLVPLWMSA